MLWCSGLPTATISVQDLTPTPWPNATEEVSASTVHVDKRTTSNSVVVVSTQDTQKGSSQTVTPVTVQITELQVSFSFIT